MKKLAELGIAGLGASLMALGSAHAQTGVYAYPVAGQSQQQQQRDHSECHEWAVNQSGFNPNRAPPVDYYAGGYSSPPPTQSGYFGQGQVGQGGAMRDAAGGAAAGALFGAIAGDAGKGAAIGALSGTLFGGVKRSNQQYQQQQWQQQQQLEAQQRQQDAMRMRDQQMRGYQQAYAACMSARQYDVQ